MTECRFLDDYGNYGTVCLTHTRQGLQRVALCSVGKAELEAQLRSLEHDLRNQQQAAMSESENAELLESRLRECEAQCAKMREALVRQLLAHGVTATEALDQMWQEGGIGRRDE